MGHCLAGDGQTVIVNDRVRTGLAFLVGAGWLFNVVAPAFTDSYESSTAIQAPLLLVLGALFATKKKGEK